MSSKNVPTPLPHGQKKFFTFSDRLGRLDFIRWQVLINFGFFIINVVILILLSKSAIHVPTINFEKIMIASWVIWFVTFYIICLFLSIRRLHDLNQSAWLSLIHVLPVISICFLFYLFFAPSNPSANQYGQATANAPIEKIILWLIFGLIIFAFSFCLLLISTMMLGAS